MAECLELIKVGQPGAEPELSRKAARLALEIGIYKETKNEDKILEEMAGRITVVALDDSDEVVGTAGLRIVSPQAGKVEHVVTHPGKRWLGIGRRMIEAVESIALGHGVLELSLESSRGAMDFYERLGYTHIEDRLFRKFLVPDIASAIN